METDDATQSRPVCDPDNRWFKLTLPDEMLRKLSRKDYYAVRHWTRVAERHVAEGLNREAENGTL